MSHSSEGVRERKVRSDKKRRVNPFLDFQTHQFLCQLAFACDTEKTPLAAEILEGCVQSSTFREYLKSKWDRFEYKVDDTCTRVNAPLSQHCYELLKELKLQLGFKASVTEISGRIIYAAVRTADVVNWIQDRHRANKYRVAIFVDYRTQKVSYIQFSGSE